MQSLFPVKSGRKLAMSILFSSPKYSNVLLTVFQDWQDNGEFSISSTTLPQLEELNEVLQFVANQVADELHERRSKLVEDKRKERDNKL